MVPRPDAVDLVARHEGRFDLEARHVPGARLRHVPLAGDLDGVTGSTNALKILRVTESS